MEKEEGGYALRPGRKRGTCLFPTAPTHCPSFFSYLPPQEFVDVSNQMYIVPHSSMTDSLKNTSITKIRKLENGWDLELYNCTIHLD
ncbi:hypothetical protein [Aneurinibacillus migulanus]|uniref:hypothetical protein n=1 Tax=Aneurinibacillus migulanus TaxID=47500 RepID=UPI001F3D5DCF|nr:hypothetical protein [Aneurinibacillus migulanus]